MIHGAGPLLEYNVELNPSVQISTGSSYLDISCLEEDEIRLAGLSRVRPPSSLSRYQRHYQGSISLIKQIMMQSSVRGGETEFL